jgi:hypothetical protein
VQVSDEVFGGIGHIARLLEKLSQNNMRASDRDGCCYIAG